MFPYIVRLTVLQCKVIMRIILINPLVRHVTILTVYDSRLSDSKLTV